MVTSLCGNVYVGTYFMILFSRKNIFTQENKSAELSHVVLVLLDLQPVLEPHAKVQ